MASLHLDFESASACDLKAEGLARYAEDMSTTWHCLAWAFDDEPADIVTPDDCCHHPRFDRVLDHVAAGGLVYAHNAAFELAIWNKVCVPTLDWPRLRPEQVRCTMAMAYAMALPGALENAAPALGIEQRKDAAGKRVMMQLCKPRDDGRLWRPEDDPAKFQILYAYCKQDVVVERALHQRMLELSPYEQKLWTLDYEINQRGVAVDLTGVDAAIKLVESEKYRLNGEMLKATGGVVGSCTEVQLLVKWIRLQGVELKGLAKADVLDALAENAETVPANVRRVLEIRQEAAKSSTAKISAMKERANADGRVRGIHQYHGANTGRWAGRGIQTQNLPRPRGTMGPSDIEDAIANMSSPGYVDMMYGPVMDAISDCVRGLLVAPKGKDLVAIDFSAIEARVLAWLASEESVLDIFRTHGKIYEHAAAGIYHVVMEAVTKAMRQIGKVAVLALGYGGGVGAFQSMAKNYGVKIPDTEADDIKKAWRSAHPYIVSYWERIETAATNAVYTGDVTTAGQHGRHVSFKVDGSFLWCRLPSGRMLCYPYPEIRTVTTPWGAEKDALTYMTVIEGKKTKCLEDPASKGSWQRISTYGGSLAENVTQAVARDLLAHAMFSLDAAGFPIVMHVHDEAVVEIASSCDADTLKKLEHLFAQTPAWAAGLPVSAEGWRARRYRK